MGAYLSQPITEKEVEDGGNARLKYAVAAMQGWRTEMEDAHVCALDIVTGTSVFGVFDGHGGREVARFVALHLVEELLATHGFKLANMSVSLKEAYLSLDALIRSDKSRSELLQLSSVEKTEEEQSLERVINVDNLPHLLREAIYSKNSNRRSGRGEADDTDSEFSEFEIEDGVDSGSSEDEEEDRGRHVDSFPIVLSDSSSSSGSESDDEGQPIEEELQQGSALNGEMCLEIPPPSAEQYTQAVQDNVVVVDQTKTEVQKDMEVTPPNKSSVLFNTSDSTDSAECRSSDETGGAAVEDHTPVSTDAPASKMAIDASTEKIEVISGNSCQVRPLANHHSFPSPHDRRTKARHRSGSAMSGWLSLVCPFPCLRTDGPIPDEDFDNGGFAPDADCIAVPFSSSSPMAPNVEGKALTWEPLPKELSEPDHTAAAPPGDTLDTDEQHSEAVQEERPEEIIPEQHMPEDINGRDVTVAGCTAVVAIIREETLYVANAGDSRCVLCRDGIALAMSHDHKPNDPEEYARIRNAGGFVSDGRVNGCLNLSRALGDMEYKRTPNLAPEEFMITANPDIKSMELQSNDRFMILACDGIWDVLSDQEACDFVLSRLQKDRSLKSIAAELCDFCLADDAEGSGEGCDNMTTVIVLLNHHNSNCSIQGNKISSSQ